MNEINPSSVLAKKICQAFNIPFVAIRDIRIELRFDGVPTLKIEKIITKDEADGIATVLDEYKITLKGE